MQDKIAKPKRQHRARKQFLVAPRLRGSQNASEQKKVVKAKPQRMVRKQILITPEQCRRLKARAEAVGQSESEIIREAVDENLQRHETEERDWKAGLRGLAGLWSDHPDLERNMADARQRRARRRHIINRRLRGAD